MCTIKLCFITILLVVAYLCTSTILSNLLFHSNAQGSLILVNKKCLGSKIIGQNFTKDYHFHGRPSLYNYRSDLSGNSNSAYYSNELKTITKLRKSEFKERNSGNEPTLNIIAESASGLDPHITEESALKQAKRIANKTNIDLNTLIKIIKEKSRPRIVNLFGERIINVLELNLKVSNLNNEKN